MLKGETINAKQASDLRAQIGVNNSYFTKRQITSTKRKAKRKADKLARVPLDENVIARLNYGRRQTGLPGVLLLRICLQNYTKNNRQGG